MSVRKAVNTITQSVGFAVRKVYVNEIITERGVAICQDTTGVHIEVPLSIRAGKGAWPMVGDVWIIDRETGGWVFAYHLSQNAPPVVKGSRTGVPPLVISLIEALAKLGLIRDESE